jgi:FKBP-type peptidyl-prolyl cis-trans isomerase FklB
MQYKSGKLSLLAFMAAGLMCVSAYADDQTTQNSVPTQAVTATKPLDGAAFLAANKTKPGVKTLEDGLQYKVIKEGRGAQPTDSDTVTVDYVGTLIDGTEFDSSYKRGQHASFQVSAVIPGWTEALKMMKVGSEWELYIPAALAYGDQGVPPVIGPNQVLIFKVHLIDVKK